MAGSPLFGLLALVLVAGGIVLQFLVILSGGINGSVENQVYFLQAATNGITPQPRNPSRWTFFSICGVDANGRNSNCGAIVPALPFDPPRASNFGTTTGVPEAFVGTREFFLLSRFMFALYLVALFFAVCALFTGLLSLCTRLGAYLSGLNAGLAWFFQAAAAAMMTAWTVRGRNIFRSNGHDAHLGVKAYGFTWGAMACYLLSMVIFCLAGRDGARANRGLGRKSSTKSRGSFAGSERTGIKDDYS